MEQNKKNGNLETENRESGSGNSNLEANSPIGSDQNASTGMDEKSSTMGRNARRNTGISTKDGMTGSDYDGQVTDGR